MIPNSSFGAEFLKELEVTLYGCECIDRQENPELRRRDGTIYEWPKDPVE